jgi:hypothetical protein
LESVIALWERGMESLSSGIGSERTPNTTNSSSSSELSFHSSTCWAIDYAASFELQKRNKIAIVD